VTFSKLDTLLIYVSDMFRGDIRVSIIDVLQELVEMCDICRIKVLSLLGIQIPRLGCTDLRMVLLKPVDLV
jgi:hypothetical protein